MKKYILLLLLLSCKMESPCVDEQYLKEERIESMGVKHGILRQIWPNNEILLEVYYTDFGAEQRVINYLSDGLKETVVNDYDIWNNLTHTRVQNEGNKWELVDSAVYNIEGHLIESFKNLNSSNFTSFVIKNDRNGNPIEIVKKSAGVEIGFQKFYWSNECQKDSVVWYNQDGEIEKQFNYFYQDGKISTIKSFGKNRELEFSEFFKYKNGLLTEKVDIDHIYKIQFLTQTTYDNGLESEMTVVTTSLDSHSADTIIYKWEYFDE